MRHVAPPREPRGIRETLRVPVVRRLQQERRRIDRPAGQDHDRRLDPTPLAGVVDLDRPDPPAARVRQQAPRPRAGPQGDVVSRGGRPDATDVGVALRPAVARERVARIAQDAASRFSRPPESQRQGRGMQPLAANPGHVCLHLIRVRNRGVGERLPRRLGRVLAGRPVDLVQTFRPLVVRLQRVVVDGPGRRDAVDVLDLAEVLAAHPEEDAAPELGVAPDAVVGIGAERSAAAVQPALRRLVAPVLPDRGGVAVLGLLRNEQAAFDQQDPGRRIGQRPGHGASPGARPDDDDVVSLAGHRGSDSPSCSGRPGAPS